MRVPSVTREIVEAIEETDRSPLAQTLGLLRAVESGNEAEIAVE